MALFKFSLLAAQVRTSLKERQSGPSPLTYGIVTVGTVGVASYIALALLAGEEGAPAKQFEEFGAVTVLSAIFLAAAGAFSLSVFFMRSRNPGLGRWFWLLAATGFLFLSLDELLQFHERFGVLVEASSVGAPDSFRNWNDILVIGYGLVGLTVMMVFLPEVLRHPRFAELVATGFVLGILHTAIDSMVLHSAEKMIVEESAKLFCVAFFAMAMLNVVISLSRRVEADAGARKDNGPLKL